jgi:hypothetical protein
VQRLAVGLQVALHLGPVMCIVAEPTRLFCAVFLAQDFSYCQKIF